MNDLKGEFINMTRASDNEKSLSSRQESTHDFPYIGRALCALRYEKS